MVCICQKTASLAIMMCSSSFIRVYDDNQNCHVNDALFVIYPRL